MQMNNEILEIINKNLPNLHAQQLGKILDKALADAAEVEKLKNKVVDLDTKLCKVEEENKRLVQYKKELDTLNSKKEELRIAQLTFEIEKKLLEQKVISEKEKTDLLNGTLNVIFKAPMIRETLSKTITQKSTSYDYQNRETTNEYQIPVFETKTTTEE